MNSTDLSQKFRETLGLAYQRVNALQRDEKRCFGVSLSRCVTLETLLREGPLPVRDLASRLGLDASTVTRSVDGPAGTNGLTVEWEPAMPKRLTKAELRRYRAARNQMLTRLAGRLGGMMAVVEL